MYYETIWNCKYTIFERTDGWNYLSHLKIFSGFLIRSKKTHKIGSNWHWYYLRISNLLAFDLPAYSRHYVPLPHTFRNILSLSLSQDKPRWGARAYVCSQSVYVMLCPYISLIQYFPIYKLDFPRVTFWGREPKKDASCRYVTVWVTSLQQYFIWAACLISIKSLVDNTDWGYIIITLLLWGTAFFASSAKNTQIECFILRRRFSSASSSYFQNILLAPRMFETGSRMFGVL